MNPDNNAKVILVVDDEEGILTIVETLLEDEGYKVFTALNGVEALEILDKNHIDLIVSDIRMPKMGGAELLDKVKERDIFKPIVLFITGFSDMTIEEAYAKGASGHIQKPFDVDNLLRQVDENLKEFPKFQKEENIDTQGKIQLSCPSLEVEWGDSHLISLGQGGLFIATNEMFNIGQVIEFEFNFNEGDIDSISGLGEIEWTKKISHKDYNLGIGLKFIKLSPEVEKKIDEYVVKQNIKAFIPNR